MHVHGGNAVIIPWVSQNNVTGMTYLIYCRPQSDFGRNGVLFCENLWGPTKKPVKPLLPERGRQSSRDPNESQRKACRMACAQTVAASAWPVDHR